MTFSTLAHAMAKTIQQSSLPSLIGFKLRRAHSAALREIDASLAEHQLTTAMHGALEVLDANEFVAQGALGQVLGLSRSAMVPIIEKLQQRGLVARERTSEDRRTVLLRITPAGRRQLAELRRLVAAHEARLHQALDGVDLDGFMKALDRLIRLK